MGLGCLSLFYSVLIPFIPFLLARLLLFFLLLTGRSLCNPANCVIARARRPPSISQGAETPFKNNLHCKRAANQPFLDSACAFILCVPRCTSQSLPASHVRILHMLH